MNQITEETFEQTLQSFINSEQIDLRDVSFIDPYGMVGFSRSASSACLKM